jgi:hypothetical protein
MNQTTTKPKGSIEDLKILILLEIPYIGFSSNLHSNEN